MSPSGRWDSQHCNELNKQTDLIGANWHIYVHGKKKRTSLRQDLDVWKVEGLKARAGIGILLELYMHEKVKSVWQPPADETIFSIQTAGRFWSLH